MITARQSIRSSVAATFAACCLMLPTSHAEAPAEAEENTVQLSFVSYPAQNNMQAFYLKTGDSSTLKINPANQYISDSYKVASMENWSLGRLKQANDGESEFESLATCKSLDVPEQLIVLGHPIDPAAGEHQMTVLDCSEKNFSYGSFLFLNLTKAEISAKIDDEKVKIGPSEHALIKPALDDGREVVQAQVFITKEQKDKLIVDARWSLQPTIRSLIIFYYGQDERILMHTVQQQMPDNLEGLDTDA